MILTAESVYVLMRNGALEYTRNRKTVQMIIKIRKTEINFDQNRKPEAKPLKTGSKTREDVHVVESVRRIFSAENLEKHQTASNSKSKTQFYFCQKPKTESEIEQKLETAIVTKTENSKFFGTTAKKNDLKKRRNRKPENPNAPVHEEQLRGINFVTLFQFNITWFASGKT